MSDPKLTPEQLAELRQINPVAHACYVRDNGGVSAMGSVAAAPAVAAPVVPTDPMADTRATYEAIKAVNPVVAARFAMATALFSK